MIDTNSKRRVKEESKTVMLSSMDENVAYFILNFSRRNGYISATKSFAHSKMVSVSSNVPNHTSQRQIRRNFLPFEIQHFHLNLS